MRKTQAPSGAFFIAPTDFKTTAAGGEQNGTGPMSNEQNEQRDMQIVK